MRRLMTAAVLLCFALLLMSACSLPLAQLEQDDIYRLIKPHTTVSASDETGRPELSGEWYGCWSLSEGQEDWAAVDGYSCDCLARLTQQGDSAVLTVWDEDTDENYHLARFHLSFDGEPYCSQAEFLDVPGQAELAADDTGMLEISGQYRKAGEGSFSYRIRLIPWGESWRDGQSRPRHYDDWYLPQADAGLTMPQSLDPG